MAGLAEAVRAWEALRQEADEEGGWEADDVQVVAFDALDERRAEALDRIRRPRGPPTRRCSRSGRGRAPSTRRNVTSVVSLCSSSQRRRPQAEAGDDLVRPARQPLEHRLRRTRIRGLAERLTVDNDLGVDPEHRADSPPSTERAFPPRARPDPAELLERGGTTSNGMPNCSRIARRCGDGDARMSGGAGGTLTRACGPSRSPRPATSAPTPPTRSRSSSCVAALSAPAARQSPSISNPLSRSSRIQSPCGSWKSTPSSSSGHSIRCSPNCGRSSRSPTFPSGSSGAQSTHSVEFRRNTSSPPGRSSRAASGIHRYGSHQIDAPYSETTRSNDASGSGTSSAFASINSTGTRALAASPRRLELRRRQSTPVTRAPRFASHAPK